MVILNFKITIHNASCLSPDLNQFGRALYDLNNSISHCSCTDLSPLNSQEYLWLRLPLCSHLLFVCVLYHPPSSDDSMYISPSLSDNMDKPSTTHPNSLFLICGDFSCHHATWLGVGTSLTSHGTSTKGFSDSMGLTQSVNFPT